MRKTTLLLFFFCYIQLYAQITKELITLKSIDKIERFERLISQLKPQELQGFLAENKIPTSRELKYEDIVGFEQKLSDEKTLKVSWKQLSQQSLNSLVGELTFNQISKTYWPALEKYFKDNSIKLSRIYNHYTNDSLTSSQTIFDESSSLAFADNYKRTSWLNKRFGSIGGFATDVSHHQGNINWEKVYNDTIPERISMVIVKATDIGTNSKKPFLSKTFKKNWEWLKKNKKFMFGAYLFYQPILSTPKIQANYFIQNVDLEKGNIKPIIDIESFPNCRGCDAKTNFISNLEKLIEIIEKHYNTSVIIYTYDNFYLKHLKDKLDLNGRYLWLARYNSNGLFHNSRALTGREPTLNDKAKVIGWQYTQEGTLEGIGNGKKCKTWTVKNSKGIKVLKQNGNCVDLNFVYDKNVDNWLIKNKVN